MSVSSTFHRPRKALGQNFLQDANVIGKIIDCLAIDKQDHIVEIGPGRGALTERLIETAAHLYLIEFDRDLAEFWQQKSTQIEHLSVFQADVLSFDFEQIFTAAQTASAESEKPLKVVGNLPYNISSPILFRLYEMAERLESITVMLQKEVVDRIVAQPNCKQYGRLSVMLQQRFSVRREFVVPPGAFFPPPKVDSAVVTLIPHNEVNLQVDDVGYFASLVKQAFSQRRKTIRNTLKSLLSESQLEQAGLNPGARAENVTVEEFVRLANLTV